jgi:hypothetical protein
MTLRSTRSGVLVAVLATLAVAACGSDAAVTTTTDSSDVTESTSPATTISAPPTTATSSTTPPTTAQTTTAPPTAPPTPPTTTTTPPVFAFDAEGAADGWGVVNDTVMGGVSSGQLALTDGLLVFTGDLSLENNGGFASMRSPAVDPGRAAEWATIPGLRLQVEGDGRTWTVEVRTDDGDGGWTSQLPTSVDGPTDTELPWASFEPVTRFLDPRTTDVPLDPARIVSVAFYLVDGIEGSFRLGVRSIG